MATNWNSQNHRNGLNFSDGFWKNGDYLQGNTNALYNAGKEGSTHSIFWMAEALKAGEPNSQSFAGHDATQEFNTYLMRAQARGLNPSDPWSSYSQFGEVRSDMNAHNHAEAYGAPYWSTALAGLAMTPETSFVEQSVAVLSVSPTDLDFGAVRIGSTSASQTLSLSNTGGILSDPITGGIQPVNSNGFFGQPNNFVLQPEDSPTTTNGYTFSPTGQGTASATAFLTSTAGDQNISLTGIGVGPEFASSVLVDSVIDFGYVSPGTTDSFAISIFNNTSDIGFDSNLTGLTLLSASSTGPDNIYFSLSGFTPGTVLAQGETLPFDVLFSALEGSGFNTATLTIVTDQNSPFGFGMIGDSFSYNFQANTVPEPSTVAMFLTGGLGLIGYRMRRRRRPV